MKMLVGVVTVAGLMLAPVAAYAAIDPAVIADPPRDAAHPAGMAVFTIPSGDGVMNAVLYTASGAKPHPTLILFHGFPGNERNFDLAQAVRRAGWNVLVFHYRGSWGSSGAFSFMHCAEDGAAALAYLRDPAHAGKYAIDVKRIAVAGHSMGGMMAARVAADDPTVLGAFLIDPWDIADTGKMLDDPAQRAAFKKDELDADMPPLAGTTADVLIDEARYAGAALNLAATVPALAGRPVVLLYAQFGNGPEQHKRIEEALRAAGPRALESAIWPTDHGFADKRIALADRLVKWLRGLNGPGGKKRR